MWRTRKRGRKRCTASSLAPRIMPRPVSRRNCRQQGKQLALWQGGLNGAWEGFSYTGLVRDKWCAAVGAGEEEVWFTRFSCACSAVGVFDTLAMFADC